MVRGRKPLPRFNVKPSNGEWNAVQIAAKNGRDAIKRAQKKYKHWGWDKLPMQATEVNVK